MVAPPRLRPRPKTSALLLTVALAASGGGASGCAADGPGTPQEAAAGDAGVAAAIGPGYRDCAEGFEPDDEGDCQEILPAETCPAGTRPTLGSRACVPVGPTAACPAGLGPDEDGWGCVAPALPACSGATRPSYAAGGCVPVGDCAAPFPPANASIVVDPNLADGDLSPTRFRTLGEAVFAAPRGAVVAVAPGTYAESIQPAREVTIVGRCAAEVRLVGTGLRAPGVFSRRTKGIVVRGVTFVDHFQGVRAEGGGEIRVEDSVIEDARLFGVIAYQPGSRVSVARSVVRRARIFEGAGGLGATADESGVVELEDAAVEDAEVAGLAATNLARKGDPTRILGQKVVVRGTSSKGTGGDAPAALAAFDLSEVVVEDSVVGFGPAFAAFASDEGHVVVRRSTLAKVAGPRALELTGVYLQLAGHVEIEDSTLHDLERASALAAGEGSRLELRRSVVLRGDPEVLSLAFGNGLVGRRGAQVSATDTALVRPAYVGVDAFDPGTTLTLERVRVVGVRASPKEPVGHGISVRNGARGALTDVAVEGAAYSSLILGEDARAELTFDGLLVLEPGLPPGGLPSPALRVQGGALVSGRRLVVRGASRLGVVASESVSSEGDPTTLDVSHAVVRGTRSFGGGGEQEGADILDGIGFAVATGAVGSLRDAVVSDSGQLGVVAGGEVALERVTVKRTSTDAQQKFGVGVLVYAPTTMDGVRLVDNRVGLGVSYASATLRRSLLSKNAIALGLNGMEVREVDGAPPAAGEREIVVSKDVSFEGNGTRVDGAALVLPSLGLGPAGPAPLE